MQHHPKIALGDVQLLADFVVRTLLDSGKTVVATVARHGEGLIAAVKGRADCELAEVTPANRERLVEQLEAWITGRVT
jgi:nucleoside-triphosphatase THEP1